ncbi:hypothetical protein SCOCK_160033 [Actinacidiphila cocklensis]|uniref:Uncharacterized protein n=1 Tax=Actinacidiphila cocklensis TaxID=887465 RepID=A0A9W4DIY9_9ACTN|nr:hypothetical protein SCOCK_160033 [Actinacidiphila cocklensis]
MPRKGLAIRGGAYEVDAVGGDRRRGGQRQPGRRAGAEAEPLARDDGQGPAVVRGGAGRGRPQAADHGGVAAAELEGVRRRGAVRAAGRRTGGSVGGGPSAGPGHPPGPGRGAGGGR